MLVLASAEGVSRCALCMLDCEDWRVCHGVLPACWSVKIGIGRGGGGGGGGCHGVLSACWSWHQQRVCYLCMLVCIKCVTVCACWSVKIGIGRGCVTVCLDCEDWRVCHGVLSAC